MASALTPGYKTSEFWTHVAVVLTAGASVLGTVFDHAFLNNHPVLAAIVTAAGILLIGMSQAAYSISRGLTKLNPASTAPVTPGNFA